MVKLFVVQVNSNALGLKQKFASQTKRGAVQECFLYYCNLVLDKYKSNDLYKQYINNIFQKYYFDDKKFIQEVSELVTIIHNYLCLFEIYEINISKISEIEIELEKIKNQLLIEDIIY